MVSGSSEWHESRFARSLLAACVAGIVGFFVNGFGLELVDVGVLLFGTIPVILVALSHGPLPGALAGAIAASRTLGLVGHPYYLLIGIVEAWAIGSLARRGKSVLVWGLILWGGIGFPLAVLIHVVLDPIESPIGFVAAAFQTVVGGLCVAVADGLSGLTPVRRILGASLIDRSSTLRTHLVRTFVVSSAVPLVALGILHVRTFEVRGRQEALAVLERAAAARRKTVDDYLLEHLRAVSVLASESGADRLDATKLGMSLERYKTVYGGFLTLLAADARGEIVAAAPRTDAEGRDLLNLGVSVADRDYFREAIATRRPFLSEAFQGRGFGSDPIVAVSAPILSSDGTPVGIVEGSLNLARFEQLHQAISSIRGASVIVVDNTGHIVFVSPDADYQILQAIDGTSLASVVNQGVPATTQYTESESGSPKTTYLVASSESPTTGWRIIVRQARTEARRDEDAFAILALLSAAAAALASFAIARLQARQITAPLFELVRVAHSLPTLDPSYVRPELPAGAALEIKSLDADLDVARQTLVRSEHETRRVLADLETANSSLRSLADDLDRRIADRTNELEQSRQRYRDLIENASDMIYTHTLEGAFTSVNAAAVRTYGYSEEEFLQLNLRDLIDTRHHKDIFRAFELRFGGAHRSPAYEMLTKTRDGRELWVEVTARVLVNESGGEGIQGIARDVTERRRIETALVASEDRYRDLFENANDLIQLVSPEGRILHVNRAWRTALGYSDEQARTMSFFDIVHATSKDHFAELFERLHAGEELERIVATFDANDGRSIVVEGTFNARFEGDRIISTRGVFRDVTARFAAEKALRESELQFRTLFEQSPVGIFRTAEDGRVLKANPALLRMLGYASFQELTATDYDKEFRDAGYPRDEFTRRLRRDGEIRGVEAAWKRRDGSVVFVSENARAICGPDGDVLYYEGTVEDITDRMEARQLLEQANARLEARTVDLERRSDELSALGSMSELLQACVSSEEAYDVLTRFGTLLFPSASGALYLSRTPSNQAQEVAVWGPDGGHDELPTPETCWGLRRGRVHYSDGSGSMPRCAHIDREGGSLCVPLMAQGETLGALVLHEPCGQTDHLKVASPLATAVGEQISLVMANLSLRISLREQAIRDPLTGLYNRRYLEETLDREVRRAARDRAPLSVVMLDIDHFKKYNDTYGHDGGDAVLCNLAAFLRSEIRAVDIACRFGGEEFTLILPDADADNVLRKLENIRLKAKELVIRHQGRSLPTVTLSMGVAAFPQHGLTGEELLRTADAALYQAKANGRDRVVVAEAVIGSD